MAFSYSLGAVADIITKNAESNAKNDFSAYFLSKKRIYITFTKHKT